MCNVHIRLSSSRDEGRGDVVAGTRHASREADDRTAAAGLILVHRRHAWEEGEGQSDWEKYCS